MVMRLFEYFGLLMEWYCEKKRTNKHNQKCSNCNERSVCDYLLGGLLESWCAALCNAVWYNAVWWARVKNTATTNNQWSHTGATCSLWLAVTIQYLSVYGANILYKQNVCFCESQLAVMVVFGRIFDLVKVSAFDIILHYVILYSI